MASETETYMSCWVAFAQERLVREYGSSVEVDLLRMAWDEWVVERNFPPASPGTLPRLLLRTGWPANRRRRKDIQFYVGFRFA